MDCSLSANTSACTMTITNIFHPPKSFLFPKHSFGSKSEKRSFRPVWCYMCMKAEREMKYKVSTKREPDSLSMRRLKTYLLSTMHQSRLNHWMLLNINREKIANLDINTIIIADEFVQRSKHHLHFFGRFL